jgi:hypothetical protein
MTSARITGPLAFAILFFVLLAGGRSNFLRDPGTFWHVTTGDRILADGFLRTDPYTFTFAGTWWVPYQWLGEVAMALVHRAGGFDLLLLGAVTIIAAVFAWLAARLANAGLSPIVAITVACFGVASASSHFHVRPHLFTIAGMALTMVMLANVESGKKPLRHLMWLVPFFAIWVNVHGGVLGGMATVLLAAGGWVVFWKLRANTPVDGIVNAIWVLGIATACCLTAFVNPYGLDLLRTWHVIMGEPVLREIIQEHSAMKWREPTSWPILGFAAFYFAVLFGAPIREWRVTWLLPVVWFVLSLDRVRHAPLFTVSALAVLPALWPQTRWANWMQAKRPDIYQPAGDAAPRWNVLLVIPVSIVCVATVLHLAKVEAPLVGANWAKHDPANWPMELLPALKQHEPHDGRNRIFNGYIDGGFLIYHVPGYKVFVDDRCEVFGGAWLKDFVMADAAPTAAIAKWEKEYGPFHFALVRVDTGFEAFFATSSEWECIQRTPLAAFYRRR